MNEFAGFAKPVIGGHWAMLRFARDGHPKRIMEGATSQRCSRRSLTLRGLLQFIYSPTSMGICYATARQSTRRLTPTPYFSPSGRSPEGVKSYR